MAKFIAISGPSATGKTSLIDCLSSHKELSGSIFAPDLYNTVWGDLVEKGYFADYSEIIHDSEYICAYMIKLIQYYKDYIDEHRDLDKIIFLDCCWLDMYIYGILNMWYSHIIKDVQADILRQISELAESVDRIYLTYSDPAKVEKRPYRALYKVYSVKANRELEVQQYKMAKYLRYSQELPSSDVSDEALFIIEDLRNLGYI